MMVILLIGKLSSILLFTLLNILSVIRIPLSKSFIISTSSFSNKYHQKQQKRHRQQRNIFITKHSFSNCLSNELDGNNDSSSSSSSTISSKQSKKKKNKPTSGDVVTINCRLVPEGDFIPEPLIDGVITHLDDIDTDNTIELEFVLGGGNYLPGLHELILNSMSLNEKIDIISIDSGWGARNPNLIATLTYESAGLNKEQIKVGVELLLQNGLQCIVTDCNDTTFTIDANPPLAGTSYSAYVELINIIDGPKPLPYDENIVETDSPYEVATFALGCFWGAELEYMRTPGVVGTAVGYTQGNVEHPTYEQVCTGTTGHTEAVLVTYNKDKIQYEKLVHLTMDRLGENKYLLNQVGNDKGIQYRHGIYYHNTKQKNIAERVIATYGVDCVTECKPATIWYYAEDYHQQYLLKGGQSARKGDKSSIRCYG